MSLKWKREDTELLITTVQQYTCLYNIRSCEYLDRTKKPQAFNNVLEVMKNSINTITLEDVKQKWRNVRTQYVQELRTMQNSKKSGCGKSDIYVPKLWCFNQLSFLKTNTKMRESDDYVEENDQDSLSCIQNSTEDENTIEELPRKKNKRVADVKELRNDLASFKTALGERKKEKKFAWLGLLVASQMENIDPDEQNDAAWQVQCLMRNLTSKKRRDTGTNSSTLTKDILELSMNGVFDENDFV